MGVLAHCKSYRVYGLEETAARNTRVHCDRPQFEPGAANVVVCPLDREGSWGSLKYNYWQPSGYRRIVISGVVPCL